jgi:acyl-CoA synthetase (AMP-forming)/AMP-acid ligase II
MPKAAPPRIHQLLDRLLDRQPERPLLIEPGDGAVSAVHVTTAAGLAAMVAVLVDELLRLGVRRGDRVLVVAENGAPHVALLLACSRLGAWSCGLNARLVAAEVAAFQAKADPRIVYFTTGGSAAAAAHAAAAAAVPSALPGLAHASVSPQSEPEAGPGADAVAAVIFTSGTTGAPKGVLVTHAGLLHFAEVSAASRGLGADDRVYAFLPMTHIFGLATVLMSALQAGAALVLRSRYEPADLLAALAGADGAPGVSQLLGPPTLFARLLSHLDARGIERLHAPALRYCYTGSAPMDLALKARVEARLGLPLHHGYGLSEYAGSLILTSLAADGRPRQDTAVGFLARDAEARIVDGNGHDVAPGDTGELWIRGPGLTPGYWRDPDATAAVMRPGGWYASGDLARRDPADGALFIVGRLKEMIIRSGFNVYPAEVEAALCAFAAIAQAAVLGQPEPDGNERVVAFVELRAGHTLDHAALAAHLRQRLAPYKRPARVHCVPALPLTTNGKVIKRELRRWLDDA